MQTAERQDKNDYIYICRIKCCTQKLEYALKKIIPTVGKCLKYRFLSKTTENVASSTCCNSVLRDSRRGPDRRHSDTSYCFTSATPFLNPEQSRTQCPLTQSCLTAQE